MKKFIATLLATSLLTTALPVLAQTNNSNTPTTNTSASTNTPKKGTLNIACMQAAINKREDSLVAMLEAYRTATVSALQTRKTALNSAWSLTDAKTRRTALRTAWKNFQTSNRQAQVTKRDTKRTTWRQYETDRRACGPSHSTADQGSGIDAQL